MPKDIIKHLIPPAYFHLAERLRSKRPISHYGLSGDYNSWAQAKTASTGYDNALILDKTRAALLKVKNGEAEYERDSVLFDEIQYSWPLLAGLLWVAARDSGTLNVLDFGGSLGSTYFQNRRFLSALSHVRWNIVEQSHYVETGKTWFEDDSLHFYPDITSCLADTQPNVVLLSSVLQYLEHPYAILDEILELPAITLLLTAHPFGVGREIWFACRLCRQLYIQPVIRPGYFQGKSSMTTYMRIG